MEERRFAPHARPPPWARPQSRAAHHGSTWWAPKRAKNRSRTPPTFASNPTTPPQRKPPEGRTNVATGDRTRNAGEGNPWKSATRAHPQKRRRAAPREAARTSISTSIFPAVSAAAVLPRHEEDIHVAAVDAAIEVHVGGRIARFPRDEEAVDVTPVDAAVLVEIGGAGVRAFADRQ